ncbi:magnesium-transporting ATPase (P-type) [Pedobacter africanus]|uniref:Magnesium-transporting ATPase (P-type) n=1 Tax=Pedobacter africanus TaxID=151894 RepID=A0ACC6KVD4_9SPHI|nr:hypothetical protein [Pedobacter africanus]MDR6783328.1 magnesium-transporting ATPase (P-type) [Pedobacter africanus]
MNTLKILKENIQESTPVTELSHKTSLSHSLYRILALLLLLLFVLQYWIVSTDPSEGFIGPNIWLMALIAFSCFIAIVALSWWLLQKFWMCLGLPKQDHMVKRFKTLTSWEQLKLYWLCFASLLLAGALCLNAIC